MGYLGFGTQKWIYTQKPRKPFSRMRKPHFSQVEALGRDYSSEPVSAGLSMRSFLYIRERKIRRLRKKTFSFIMIIIFTAIILFISFHLFSNFD